MRETDPQSCQ